MYSNILVPVATSDHPHTTEAIEIARAMLAEGGKITLLHVIEEIPSYIRHQLPPDAEETAIQSAQAWLGEMARGAGGADARVVVGHAGNTIVEYAQTHGNDCIVIASHRPGFQDLFLGSTAARVVRHATCSVHVVR